jgi:hypothetical protein
MKDKNDMIISKYAEKAFDRSETLPCVKYLIEEDILTKCVYENPIANIILNGARLCFSPKIRNEKSIAHF